MISFDQMDFAVQPVQNFFGEIRFSQTDIAKMVHGIADTDLFISSFNQFFIHMVQGLKRPL